MVLRISDGHVEGCWTGTALSPLRTRAYMVRVSHCCFAHSDPMLSENVHESCCPEAGRRL